RAAPAASLPRDRPAPAQPPCALPPCAAPQRSLTPRPPSLCIFPTTRWSIPSTLNIWTLNVDVQYFDVKRYFGLTQAGSLVTAITAAVTAGRHGADASRVRRPVRVRLRHARPPALRPDRRGPPPVGRALAGAGRQHGRRDLGHARAAAAAGPGRGHAQALRAHLRRLRGTAAARVHALGLAADGQARRP